MATSDNTADRMVNRTDGSTPFRPTRYDLVLAVIPSVFIVSILVGHLLSLSPRVSIVAASLVGALAVGDALFVNPPETGGSE